MKTIRPGVLFVVIAAAFFGCISVNKGGFRMTGRSDCRMLMIYGRGPSTPSEGERPGEQRMTVFVELSDTVYAFGHLTETGDFSPYFEGPWGRFAVAGGTTWDFAIRELPPPPDTLGLGAMGDRERVGIVGTAEATASAVDESELEVYPVSRHATCEFKGPVMEAAKAIVPPMDEPYQSIVVFTYLFPGPDTVVVELTTSSPNGFALAP